MSRKLIYVVFALAFVGLLSGCGKSISSTPQPSATGTYLLALAKSPVAGGDPKYHPTLETVFHLQLIAY